MHGAIHRICQRLAIRTFARMPARSAGIKHQVREFSWQPAANPIGSRTYSSRYLLRCSVFSFGDAAGTLQLKLRDRKSSGTGALEPCLLIR